VLLEARDEAVDAAPLAADQHAVAHAHKGAGRGRRRRFAPLGGVARQRGVLEHDDGHARELRGLVVLEARVGEAAGVVVQ